MYSLKMLPVTVGHRPAGRTWPRGPGALGVRACGPSVRSPLCYFAAVPFPAKFRTGSNPVTAIPRNGGERRVTGPPGAGAVPPHVPRGKPKERRECTGETREAPGRRAGFELAAAAAVAGVLPAAASTGAGGSSIGGLHNVKTVASTIPANGDLNPYGVAIVLEVAGNLTAGDVLVSNFNNAANQQGRGTTIVEVSPKGQQKLFAKIPAKSVPGGVGLTTALAALRSGWVIVGQPADGGRDVRDHAAR